MEKMKLFFRNLSFRKSFILYVCIALFIAYLASSFTSSYCRQTIFLLEANTYGFVNGNVALMNDDGSVSFDGELPDYSIEDKQRIAILNAVAFLCVPIDVGIAVVIAAMLFYRSKMKKPLNILVKASDLISKNDLDFTVDYMSNDEMGKLSAAFEKMRGALAQNNDLMWRQMEQRKQLNAMFAHDLRTPLTVLKGYAEILQQADEQKTRDTALTMAKQVDRLERYADSMSRMQKIEDAEPEYKQTDLNNVSHSIEQMAILMCKSANKKLDFHNTIPETSVVVDKDMIMQVVENLVSNAVRYAKESIKISVDKSSDTIAITVCDDGDGFSDEGIRRAAEPYYSTDKSKSNHFGLGLYTSKILCRRHGGDLVVGNNGGARVKASFKIKNAL